MNTVNKFLGIDSEKDVEDALDENIKVTVEFEHLLLIKIKEGEEKEED